MNYTRTAEIDEQLKHNHLLQLSLVKTIKNLISVNADPSEYQVLKNHYHAIEFEINALEEELEMLRKKTG